MGVEVAEKHTEETKDFKDLVRQAASEIAYTYAHGKIVELRISSDKNCTGAIISGVESPADFAVSFRDYHSKRAQFIVQMANAFYMPESQRDKPMALPAGKTPKEAEPRSRRWFVFKEPVGEEHYALTVYAWAREKEGIKPTPLKLSFVLPQNAIDKLLIIIKERPPALYEFSKKALANFTTGQHDVPVVLPDIVRPCEFYFFDEKPDNIPIFQLPDNKEKARQQIVDQLEPYKYSLGD